MISINIKEYMASKSNDTRMFIMDSLIGRPPLDSIIVRYSFIFVGHITLNEARKIDDLYFLWNACKVGYVDHIDLDVKQFNNLINLPF